MCDQESASIIRETGRREVNNNSIGGLEGECKLVSQDRVQGTTKEETN